MNQQICIFSFLHLIYCIMKKGEDRWYIVMVGLTLNFSYEVFFLIDWIDLALKCNAMQCKDEILTS